jgi:hypothetical protein
MSAFYQGLRAMVRFTAWVLWTLVRLPFYAVISVGVIAWLCYRHPEWEVFKAQVQELFQEVKGDLRG